MICNKMQFMCWTTQQKPINVHLAFLMVLAWLNRSGGGGSQAPDVIFFLTIKKYTDNVRCMWGVSLGSPHFCNGYLYIYIQLRCLDPPQYLERKKARSTWMLMLLNIFVLKITVPLTPLNKLLPNKSSSVRVATINT